MGFLPVASIALPRLVPLRPSTRPRRRRRPRRRPFAAWLFSQSVCLAGTWLSIRHRIPTPPPGQCLPFPLCVCRLPYKLPLLLCLPACHCAHLSWSLCDLLCLARAIQPVSHPRLLCLPACLPACASRPFASLAQPHRLTSPSSSSSSSPSSPSSPPPPPAIHPPTHSPNSLTHQPTRRASLQPNRTQSQIPQTPNTQRSQPHIYTHTHLCSPFHEESVPSVLTNRSLYIESSDTPAS